MSFNLTMCWHGTAQEDATEHDIYCGSKFSTCGGPHFSSCEGVGPHTREGVRAHDMHVWVYRISESHVWEDVRAHNVT